MSTQVSTTGQTHCRSMGQTFWVRQTDDGDLGIAWDWVELDRGVLAMADPMAVMTNLRLIGDEGALLSPLQSAPHFNHIVHSLPWQQEVEQVLGQGAAPRPARVQ